MKRQIFRKLHEYNPKIKLKGKLALIYREECDRENSFTVYGTVENRTSDSITLGGFVDIQIPFDYGARIKNISSYDEMHNTIKFLNEMHKIRLIGDPKRFELSDKVDCYIIETI